MFNGTENQLDHKLLHKIHSKRYTKRFILSVTSFWTYMYAYPELQFFQGIVILDANLITREKKEPLRTKDSTTCYPHLHNFSA